MVPSMQISFRPMRICRHRLGDWAEALELPEAHLSLGWSFVLASAAVNWPEAQLAFTLGFRG